MTNVVTNADGSVTVIRGQIVIMVQRDMAASPWVWIPVAVVLAVLVIALWRSRSSKSELDSI